MNYGGSSGTPAASAGGDGFYNTVCNPAATTSLTLQEAPLAENNGFISRIYSNPQSVATIDPTTGSVNGGINAFNWLTQRASVSSTIAQQNARSAFALNNTGTVAAGAYAGHWVHMLLIRLIDLHPIFNELELTGNPQLKLRLKINSGYVDIDAATDAASPPNYTMKLISAVLTSGRTCPIMVASGNAYNPMTGILAASKAATFRVAFGPVQNSLCTVAQTGSIVPYTTARLNVPFYDLARPTEIVQRPIKTIRFLDCYAQYFQGRTGLGAIDGQIKVPINLTLSGSWKNIKYIALILFSETSSGHYVTATNVEQFASPFDSAPYTCQPGRSETVFNETVTYEIIVLINLMDIMT